MPFAVTDIGLAHELDAQDELAAFRQEFVVAEPDLIYLDGNSLGRLPRRTAEALRHEVEHGWGERLIRGWNDGWIDTPSALGAKVARLIGAGPDEVLVADSTSVNLFKLAAAALGARPGRPKIVSDVLNFPSDLYVLQGLTRLLDRGHRLHLIRSADGVAIAPADVAAALDEQTALVTLSHAAFKSAFLHDMAAVTAQAHAAGALTLWDLSHAVGAVPIDLNGCDADLAVGCTYKYLNGGPGAPAFLYVRRDLQRQLVSPLWGWFGAAAPFAFDLEFTPAEDLSRFRVGTPPILSMKAVEPALDLALRAGIGRLRAKSVRQTEYLIVLADQWLLPLGFTLGSPRPAAQRGAHVSLRHPEGYRICRALIEADPPAVRVIPDFREPDSIRLGVAPIYTTFEEIHRALVRIREVVEQRLYEAFPQERLTVT